MVFSSIPVYPNWNQQSQQLSVVDGGENPQLPPLPPPSAGGSGGLGLVKPSSMLERAKLAKIPVPETALKCPRCDSTNTKFCYFNNYSLTQPRHFCKTCRRYWTRGGALRNVPVGGGCRRNKRTKGSNRSKSPSKASSSSSTGLITNISSTNDILGHSMPPTLPILPPLNQLHDFNSAGIGLNYGGIPNVATATGGGVMNFQAGSTNSVGNFISSGLVDQLRFQQMQQFPSLTNLEPQNALYSYEGEGVGTPSYVSQLRSKPLDSVVTQFATVKMEENYQQQQGLNLSKHISGFSGNDQYWTGNATFSDLPGFTSSSSTSHLL